MVRTGLEGTTGRQVYCAAVPHQRDNTATKDILALFLTLLIRQLSTCQTVWYQSPCIFLSLGDNEVQRHEVGKGW